MLNTDQIIRIISESSLATGIEVSSEVIRSLYRNHRTYEEQELHEFKRDLMDSAHQAGLQIFEYRIRLEELKEFIEQPEQALLFFSTEKNSLRPFMVVRDRKKLSRIWLNTDQNDRDAISIEELEQTLGSSDQIELWSIMKLEQLVSEAGSDNLKPITRFIHLLFTEKKDIFYIFLYAFFIGLISLVIPLGIQTTIELISGGVFFSSVYILIGGIIIGVLMAGGMQVFQLTLVEYLQRRIFTKAAFEFAYRFPHIDTSSIKGIYAPGLVNRFFDVITLQKGLPKFLIEFSGAGLQIIFGLLLLSAYHPFFVFFGLGLLAFLSAIFYLTGPNALKTSIQESSYKYKLIHWLEDVARLHRTLKQTGTTTLPVMKTDFFVNNYLKNRKSHFRILLVQFTYIVIFKAAIIGGLLIIGTILVVDREITLGQFVASEVIIILILNSVEKIIMYMDVIYDLLTAVDKIGAVTDLKIFRLGGLDLAGLEKPISINLMNVTMRHPDSNASALSGINLEIASGEKVCIAGQSGSGKSTLFGLLAGLYSGFEGSVMVNGYSLRDLDLTFYRDHLAANGPESDVFEGTLLDNVTVGNPKIKTTAAIDALSRAGLGETIASWHNGIDTTISSAGETISAGLAHRIMMARCIARNPQLMLLSDFFSGFSSREKLQLLNPAWNMDGATVICFSNDPAIMAACDRVVVLENGAIKTQGKFNELLKQGTLNQFTA